MNAEEIIKLGTERNEFFTLEDGYVYWFPSCKGGVSSWELRVIADHLDKCNKEWDEKINNYFNSQVIPKVKRYDEDSK